MIVECTNCHSKYNIDESKIPETGVKVRCPKCQNVISIKKEILPPTPPPEPVKIETPPPTVEPPTPPKVEPPIPEKVPEPPPPEPEVPPPPPEPEAPEAEAIQAPVVPQREQETVTKPITPPPIEMSEEDKKWHERARRLAKALASDLVLYNQAKVEQGLRDGTLIQLLGAEIKRSWEYYCQQIPKHIIENSDYFKEQLNKVVGKGKEIFK